MERVQLNPLIPGFAPDPSLVFVDGTYFLVNSSFHIFPGLPIYASKNLQDWKQIGNAINRPSQLKLWESRTKIVGDPDSIVCSQGGLYAPTIRYNNGTFYIVCTNVIHTSAQHENQNDKQNFILSTTDIWSDKWSDPVFYDFWAIDTSLFWDDDGKVYVAGAADEAPDSCIRQFQIDLETGKKLSESKVLWNGITRVYPEGPHMYKKDGWYYLLIAEGGCFEDHHVIMARSRNIWGPYEVNPANPVLPKTVPNADYIQYTGHGDLFQDHAGQWYFVCLGVRKKDGRFIMGRESVLTTAIWPEGEFPLIKKARLDVPLALDRPKGRVVCPTLKSPVTNGNATSHRPDVGLVHIRDPELEKYTFDGDGIELSASTADIDQFDKPVTFVGRRQRSLDGSASTTLELSAEASVGSQLKTGLCYYKDEHRFVRVFVDLVSDEIVNQLVNKAKSTEKTTARKVGALGDATHITFGMDYTEMSLSFWFSLTTVGGLKEKDQLAEIDTMEMTGHDFVGPIIGIFAVGREEAKARYPTGMLMERF
ncbi:putative xylosidase/arabinosidase [Plectosphaerella plurivora]|uniref:Xylosidase/arabinosidase n=1 Tax=Plectosphaerella plurivora TaxID=936078 RepID=A0A9P8VE41_9PEZI|nr:putative xylosidase/arabinosidase [Plectosphaerella plurivora]